VKKSRNTLQNHKKSRLSRQRNGLLAIVHIAKKDLGLDDGAYRDVLGFYGVSSASALSVAELEDLVGHFESRGFRKTKDAGRGTTDAGRNRMAEALRARIWEEALGLENGEKRLGGIVKSVANVDDLRFCRNVGKLKRILKIVTVYKKQEAA
jgi:phage gp16-like protein